ncbi:hypothetical protein A5482_004695 [Cyanobacterium sp. IPPAS B-1200]|uniref:hypothetical protein n=1 Tax=Cyanobacterium sp. IPPAS B-1200 TaxID=1562720 RepID=UPI0008527993|nr:hypothetical protein [Cyanobacterium sp. IPPAS B-1200]OEJ78608.1 hypothetical protein A5482_01640 [Cyanobacterium sp. IPPAS B-1200]
MRVSNKDKKISQSTAIRKLQTWIKSKHLICSGSFFILETVEYSMIERFETFIRVLGGTLITVDSSKRILIGNHRKVILYQAKASLHTPHHDLRDYWKENGCNYTYFDERRGFGDESSTFSQSCSIYR